MDEKNKTQPGAPPVPVALDDLFAIIGRQMVEIQALRRQLAAAAQEREA